MRVNFQTVVRLLVAVSVLGFIGAALHYRYQQQSSGVKTIRDIEEIMKDYFSTYREPKHYEGWPIDNL